jgi:hypothetical protein
MTSNPRETFLLQITSITCFTRLSAPKVRDIIHAEEDVAVHSNVLGTCMSLLLATTLILFSATMYLWMGEACSSNLNSLIIQLLGHKKRKTKLLLDVYNHKVQTSASGHAIKG